MLLRQLVWFRNDLRTSDHPGLHAAAERGETTACYCMSSKQWREHDMGDRRIAFQHRALQALADDLSALNIPLKLLQAPRFEDVPDALLKLCAELQVGAVHFIDEYPINERARDAQVSETLRSRGIDVVRHTADVIFAPGQLLTGAGRPYTVFTPFFKQWRPRLDRDLGTELPTPEAQAHTGVDSDPLPDTCDGVAASLDEDLWPAGEAAAQKLLFEFLDERVAAYPEARDIPAEPGTSRLSAHLAIGAISPRTCVAAALRAKAAVSASAVEDGVEKWIAELAWRDFYRHIAAQFDHINCGYAFKREYDRLRWREAPDELAAWQRGETGYPLVDAGMRQLNATGWMHNRLRMVTAMFLTKHLLIDWREGERYFMQQLVDGDFASNNGGWQWSASVGTDAAPYFRIFNPATQGERFDPRGHFVKAWIPALIDVPARQLFKAKSSKQADLLDDTSDYPAPMVDHKAARERALALFKDA